MRLRRLPVVVTAATVLAIAAPASPVSAQPVDESTFVTSLEAAVQSWAGLAGQNVSSELVVMDTSGRVVGRMVATVNADGSGSVSGDKIDGLVPVRCVTASRCWSFDAASGKWRKGGVLPAISASDVVQAVRDITENGSSELATFDIEGGVFTVTDRGKTTSDRVTGTFTVNGDTFSMSLPDRDFEGSSRVTVDIDAPAVQVKKPPKRLIARS